MDYMVENTSILGRKKKNLSDEQRRTIVEQLFLKSKNTKLQKGALKEIAAMFSVTPKTVSRIWQRANYFFTNGLAIDVSSKRQGRVGRKRMEINFDKVLDIPLRKRTNLRSLSEALNVAKTTLYRRMKEEGAVRRHSNALKPYLTEEGKKTRLKFCLSMLEPRSLNSNPTFKDMYDYVHIDEKWFYMSKESEWYYLHPNEIEPVRTCKSKRFICKVMFLAAVARPRYDVARNQEFSGKIGIFPFVIQEPAKRNSKNRVAGTMETKAITSITKETIRFCLIRNVLPAIRSKWPRGNEIETIYIQQDNAEPHIHESDFEFIQAACTDGFDIRLSFQPPNSPDLNVLDLGYFRAIQSLQHKEAPTTIDELVHAVEKSFEQQSSESLNHVFLSLQACMGEVIKSFGGNTYKLPHIGKNRMERNGDLPTQLQCDRDVVEMAIAHLQNEAN